MIDDDLGKSGTSSVERHGFQRLIAEIGLGKAGLVLSLDASRLARNNHDWHQLLELCSIFGVLIADGERHKAARGELRLPLPAGLVQERHGGIALNPDASVGFGGVASPTAVVVVAT